VIWPPGKRGEILARMATVSVTPTAETPAVAPCSATLALALGELAELQFRLGNWTGAYASTLEALRRAGAKGPERGVATGLSRMALIEAGRGRATACREHAREALRLLPDEPGRAVEALTREALGILALGLGDAHAAAESFEWLAEHGPQHPRVSVSAPAWALDLADAYVLRGDRHAAEALATLLDQAPCSSAHSPLAFERARADLYRGERLRAAGRRGDVRRPLHAALRTFEALGADPWAARARRALGAVA
jgi:tetratricopeptide (TPR) repeat protein